MDDIAIAKKYINKDKNAEKAGHSFELTFSQYKRLMHRKTCAFSGLPFSEYPERWDSRTLDRVDNNKGYTVENTVACCRGVNQIKALVENGKVPMDIKTLVKTALSIELATKGVKR